MKPLKVYVCGVDWQEELNNFKANDVKVYCDLNVLKKEKTCWEECGVVELNVTLSKWVEPQDLFKNIGERVKK